MGSNARPSITKRQKELARQERNRQKTEKRAQREAERRARPEPPSGVDPDIEGIVPGPQPLPFEDLLSAERDSSSER